MFQQQLVCVLALFAALIPGHTLAVPVSNQVELIDQHSVDVNQTSAVDEVTRSIGDLTVSTPVSAKSFRQHKMNSLPVEMLEEIMSKQWTSSSLAALPVEMLPLLAFVRHVTVDSVPSLAAIFKGLPELKWIDLTPLNWRSIDEHDVKLMLKMLAKIIQRQAKPPTVIGDINSFYITAIRRLYDQYDIIRVLLSTPSLFEQIDPTAGDNYANEYASLNGHVEVVKLLLNDGRCNPTADNNYAIQFASLNGHSEVVNLLLNDNRVDPSVVDNSAIREASRNGHVEVVRLLLKHSRVNPAADDNFAIQFASENGHTEVVRLLLNDSRVDPTYYDNYAIRYASKNGHADVVKLLLAVDDVDPTANDNFAIRYASAKGHTEVVKLLSNDSRVMKQLNLSKRK